MNSCLKLMLQLPMNLPAKLTEVMQSVLKISVPLIVEVGQGNNWDEAH